MNRILPFFLVAVLLFTCKQTNDLKSDENKKITESAINSNLPLVAPKNKFVADGVYPIPHGEPAQQDATDLAGPEDVNRTLNSDEIQYVFTGPGSIGGYTSNIYSNGERVLWLSAIN